MLYGKIDHQGQFGAINCLVVLYSVYTVVTLLLLPSASSSLPQNHWLPFPTCQPDALRLFSPDFLIHQLTCFHFPHQPCSHLTCSSTCSPVLASFTSFTTDTSPDALFLCQFTLVGFLPCVLLLSLLLPVPNPACLCALACKTFLLLNHWKSSYWHIRLHLVLSTAARASSRNM